jgi:hypothetical protein
MERTIDEIQKEYTQACAELGNLKYQSEIASEDYDKFYEQQLEKINTVIRKMKKLNNEATEVLKKPKVEEVKDESQS